MQPEIPDNNAPRVFRLCQRCGRPTPAQTVECVNCGARALPEFVENDQARAEQVFAKAYFSRATPVTFGILGLNLIIYLFMTVVAGGDFFQHLVFGVDPETLIAFGAKTNELLRTEWFRLVTPIFIHGGLIHIASNSYALWIVGPQVERLYGSARFLLVYLLCGIGGVAGSYIGSALLGRNPGVPSVGASGAIFGLFGVLALFGYKYRNELPANFRRAFGSSVFPVIAINLFIGFSVPVIDNGAHVGGLLCGAILTLIIPYLAPGKERTSGLGLVVVALCVLVVAFSFYRAGQQSSQHLMRRASLIGPFLDSINEAKAVLAKSFRSTDDQNQRAMLTSELADAVDKLESSRAPDSQAAQIVRGLTILLREQRAALEDPVTESRGARLKNNAASFASLDRELRQWVASEGARLGIVESQSDERKP